MDIIETPAYRKAFIQYLRKGTAIEISLKAAANERSTTHYIWRTSGDNKVRASHAANSGKIFAWDNPPETGHPGEDYNCRCTAEPYTPEVNESSSQWVTSIVDEGLRRWAWYDFFNHFFLGAGEAIRLSHVGHLQDVIDESRQHVFKGVERQVLRQARAAVTGSLNDTFENTYPYYSVTFVHGRSTVKGRYNGSVTRKGNALHITVEVEYNFSDVFTDPFDLRERNGGSSDPRAIPKDKLIDGEFGGQYYTVYDSWTTRLTAVMHIDANKSGYRG